MSFQLNIYPQNQCLASCIFIIFSLFFFKAVAGIGIVAPAGNSAHFFPGSFHFCDSIN